MIKLYNSLAREKQVFEPIDPSHVRVYACGPTVYGFAHIGNARMAVVFDPVIGPVTVNALTAYGVDVTCVLGVIAVPETVTSR